MPEGTERVWTSFYAVRLYPDSIRRALDESDVNPSVSGRFELRIRTDEETAVQTLHLDVELDPHLVPPEGLADRVRQHVVETLITTNREYGQLRDVIGSNADPVIVLVPFGSNRMRYGPKHVYLERDE